METDVTNQNHNHRMTELPPQITVDLTEDLRSYWRDRLRQHTADVYAGVTLSKLPEDLRTYEHLIWSDRPDTIVEIGTQHGGSALWFRDRLRTLQSYGLVESARVVTVDIDQSLAKTHLARADPDYARTIHLVEGDVRDDTIADAVRELVGSRCFVVEDSAHEYDTTFAALDAFSQFVPAGGYFIIEDGSVDVETLRLIEAWPHGVLPALRDWLETEQGRDFEVRRDLELYGITSHPSGFLQRSVEDGGPLRRNYGDDDALVPHPLDVRLGAQIGDRDRLAELLVDAEQRLSAIPDLQVRIVDLEYELEAAHGALERAQEQAGILDERLTRSQRVLTDVLSSPSWRITQPLRTLKHRLRG